MAFTILNICTTLLPICAWIILSILLVLNGGESFSRSSFFALQKNHYLPDHVIHTTTVTSNLECSMACLAHDDCQSWNMEMISSGYTCELNNVTMETAAQNDNTHLVIKEGAQFGQRVSIASSKLKSIIYLFTSLGAQGLEGPNDVTQYEGTSLQGQVTLDNGIQKWTVPHTGTYEIEARGASGANGTCRKNNRTLEWHFGGLGARKKGRFDLKKGTVLKILIGQSGTTGTNFGERPGGGGGGTFVTFNDSMPLIIAGGGGGGGGCIVAQGMSDGDLGQMGELGSQCNSTVKQGGLVCADQFAGAGAGLLGDGKANGESIGSYAFVNGGKGGSIHIGSLGGFGGGGFGWLLAGGGGGYSGGGVSGNSTGGVAGGGGSFNNGFEVESGICDSRGDGLVKINLIG